MNNHQLGSKILVMRKTSQNNQAVNLIFLEYSFLFELFRNINLHSDH